MHKAPAIKKQTADIIKEIEAKLDKTAELIKEINVKLMRIAGDS